MVVLSISHLPLFQKKNWAGVPLRKMGLKFFWLSISQNTLFDQFSEKKNCVGSPLGKWNSNFFKRQKNKLKQPLIDNAKIKVKMARKCIKSSVNGVNQHFRLILTWFMAIFEWQGKMLMFQSKAQTMNLIKNILTFYGYP